jgi:X-X-X-Leu-X-X-Gly heptad repeat protein
MRNLKKWTALSLTLSLMLTAPLAWAAETKSEVVYANLQSTGAVSRVAVVNKFDLDEAKEITDYGKYVSLTNLTSLAPLAASGDTVTAKADAGSFYYEGVLSSWELPWDIDVTYLLDGQPVAPEALGGKSGHLTMTIDVRKNERANTIYFDNYTLQMQVVLDGSKCSSVRAPESTVADQGSDILLTCLTLPGSEKKFTIDADVTDFELDAISANGIPLNVDVNSIDTSDIKSQVSELKSGIRQLDDGASQLDTAVAKLDAGTSTLSQSATLIGNGVTQLASGAGQLATKSQAVLTGLKSLSSGLSQLAASAGQIGTAGAQLSGGADQLASSLSTLSTQLDTLITASGTIKTAIGTLKDAAAGCSGDISNVSRLISVISGYPDIASEYSKYIASGRTLIGTLQGLSSGLTSLYGQYSTFDGSLTQVKTAVDQLQVAASTLSGGITQLVTPISQLAGAVSSSGAVDSTSSVATQYAAFDAAVQSLATSLDKLDENYQLLENGIDSLDTGMGKMDKGTGKLTSGTKELKSRTGDMDSQVDEAVDKAISKFENNDFTPASFVDARNQVSLVQFVLRFDKIDAPEAQQVAAQAEPEDDTFWGKLTKLFEGWGGKL